MSVSRNIVLLISISITATTLTATSGADALVVTKYYINYKANTAMKLTTMTQVLDEEGVTPLMRAVRDGEHDQVKALLKQGVDVNVKDSHGWTALIYGAARGDASSVKALIAKGAEVNAANDRNESALALAIRMHHKSMANLLRRAGAAETRNETRTTPPTTPLSALPQSTFTRAEPLNRPEPSYTSKTLDKGAEGLVRLRIIAGSDGTVKRIRILTGLPYGLTYKAVEAAYQLRFKPATKDGQPVAYWLPVEIEFHIKR